MYSHRPSGFTKHLDFTVIDIIAMYAAYFLTCLILKGTVKPTNSDLAYFVCALYLASNVLTVFLFDSFKNVLKRGHFIELYKTAVHVGLVTLFVIAFLYAAHVGQLQSRLQIGITMIIYWLLSYACREVNKKIVKNRRVQKNAPAVLVVTTADRVHKVLSSLRADEKEYQFNLAGVCVIDEDSAENYIEGVPVVATKDTLLEYACHNWIDEVLFELGHGYVTPDPELQAAFLQMGITTHTKIYRKNNEYEWERSVEKFGPYMVLTRSAKIINDRQRFAKRAMDILGALVGCVITAILFIFIAPIIYIQSPGPVFFKQERIGMNGRHFKMYKFRSMVINADELKKKYMAQNRVSDGMMFKLDWDPRIIGNKELPDGTKKTGIGEFIRKTSIDEFPQFVNVLKGEMSLVGTRPPTLDEWNKYDLHHRGRMAIKPGITGMWQVSGRSEITDFEEVVRLDREYISNWSFGMDIKILLKTVAVVLKHKGSM